MHTTSGAPRACLTRTHAGVGLPVNTVEPSHQLCNSDTWVASHFVSLFLFNLTGVAKTDPWGKGSQTHAVVWKVAVRTWHHGIRDWLVENVGKHGGVLREFETLHSPKQGLPTPPVMVLMAPEQQGPMNAWNTPDVCCAGGPCLVPRMLVKV